MSLFKTYLEQVKTEMNPDELNLKKLAMEVVGYNPEAILRNILNSQIEFMKFLFYKLAIKSTKFNTIQLWEKLEKNIKKLKSISYEDFHEILMKSNTPESEIKRAQRIFDDKFTEDNKIPFFTKLAEEKTHNKQLIKKVIKDIWG